MIHGAHVIVYSKDADADRAFFRDVLKYRHADAGHGWLIFALPPAEVAVHPGKNDVHELYLMCDDVDALVAEMGRQGFPCSPVHQERWGKLTGITLPGGGKLGIYEPLHASPLKKEKATARPRKPARKAARKPAKKAKKAARRR